MIILPHHTGKISFLPNRRRTGRSSKAKMVLVEPPCPTAAMACQWQVIQINALLRWHARYLLLHFYGIWLYMYNNIPESYYIFKNAEHHFFTWIMIAIWGGSHPYSTSFWRWGEGLVTGQCFQPSWIFSAVNLDLSRGKRKECLT